MHSVQEKGSDPINKSELNKQHITRNSSNLIRNLMTETTQHTGEI